MRRKIIVRGDRRSCGEFVGELLEPRRLLSGYALHVLSTFSQPEGSSGEIVEDQASVHTHSLEANFLEGFAG